MASFQAVYVVVDPGEANECEKAIRKVLRQENLDWCEVRHTAKCDWWQLRPAIVEVPTAVINPVLGVPFGNAWPGLSAFARRLSEAWSRDVVTLEIQTSVDWIRFSRWKGGHRSRALEYCSQEEDEFAMNEGDAEPWERNANGEQVCDGPSVAAALSLPGFDRTPWTRELTLRQWR